MLNWATGQAIFAHKKIRHLGGFFTIKPERIWLDRQT